MLVVLFCYTRVGDLTEQCKKLHRIRNSAVICICSPTKNISKYLKAKMQLGSRFEKIRCVLRTKTDVFTFTTSTYTTINRKQNMLFALCILPSINRQSSVDDSGLATNSFCSWQFLSYNSYFVQLIFIGSFSCNMFHKKSILIRKNIIKSGEITSFSPNAVFTIECAYYSDTSDMCTDEALLNREADKNIEVYAQLSER